MKLSIRKKYHRGYTYFASVLCFLCTTQISSAEVVSYQSMTSIPGLSGTGNLVEFINSAYVTLIAVGATWGVIKIAFAGFKYSLSEVVSSKSEALNDIKGVFAGLAVLLMPFVVLNTIYSPLTNLGVLKKLEKVVVDIPKEEGFLIPTGGEAPVELLKVCPENLRSSFSGICCADINYSGEFACASNTATGTVIAGGIDTGKIYTDISEVRRVVGKKYDYTETSAFGGKPIEKKCDEGMPVLFSYKSTYIDGSGISTQTGKDNVESKIFCLSPK